MGLRRPYASRISGLRARIGRSLRDLLWLAGGQAIGLVATLLATPLQLERMGGERYGTVVLLASMLGYLGLLDLGTGWAVTRFVAHHLSIGQPERATSALGSALTVALISGVCGGVLAASVAEPLVGVFRVTPENSAAVVDGMRVLALALPFALGVSVLSGAARALQLFRLGAVVSASNAMALNAVWLWAAGRPHDVVIVVATQGALLVGQAALWIVVLRRHSALMGAWQPGLKAAKEVVRFGGQYSATQAGYGALTQADKPILAALIPVSVMPQYTIPFSLAVRATLISTPVASVLFPRLVGAVAQGGHDELSMAAARALRGVAVLAGTALALMLFAGHPFLEIWIGRSFADAAYPPLAVLAVGFCLLTAGSPAGVLLDARGRPDLHAWLVIGGGGAGLAVAGLLAALLETPLAGGLGIGLGLAVIGLGALAFLTSPPLSWPRVTTIQIVFFPWVVLLSAAAAVAVLSSVLSLSPLLEALAVGAVTAGVAARLLLSALRLAAEVIS